MDYFYIIQYKHVTLKHSTYELIYIDCFNYNSKFNIYAHIINTITKTESSHKK